MDQKQQLQTVATLAASHVLSQVSEHITDLVQHEALKVLPSVPPENIQQANSPRFTRTYVNPPSKPVSNYAEVMMRSTMWRAKRGERLAILWMGKPGTMETLQVEQYGNECSVLRRDEIQPRAQWESGRLKKAGKSCWVQFDPIAGQIDAVAAKLMTKGWVIKPPAKNVVQLTLVEDLKPIDHASSL